MGTTIPDPTEYIPGPRKWAGLRPHLLERLSEAQRTVGDCELGTNRERERGLDTEPRRRKRQRGSSIRC
jgi:hypothetical protein